tara:strand:+ start:150 stop:758 length:609 start_codon:yes stop_codon:yes gene_type:complete
MVCAMGYRFKKIYFNGCSWTWGSLLDNPHAQRYSKLLCNELRAEECNFAIPGGSTRRVARHMIGHDMSQYALIIVQMTYNQRTEFYQDNEWKKVKIPMRWRNPEDLIKYEDFWDRYYRDIYSEKYGSIDEHVYYNFFRSFLKDKPHIIMKVGDRGKGKERLFSSDPVSGLDYDIRLPECPVGKSHPDAQGHRDICQSILDIL